MITLNDAVAGLGTVGQVAMTMFAGAPMKPSGKKVPPASNEDGFFVLLATDAVVPDPEIFVHDTGSSFVAGPFPSGTTIKLVQAPGATPSVSPGPGEIDWMIKLKGDAELVAVDDSGNESDPVACLSPPPPK